MKLSLREQLEQLALHPAEDPAPCGSPERFELRWQGQFPGTIPAIIALRKRGLSLADAKAAIERLMEQRYLAITLPCVIDADDLVAEINTTGAIAVLARPVTVKLTVSRGVRLGHPIPAIKALRDRGLTLLEAKTAYETMMTDCHLVIELPAVGDMAHLAAVLSGYGITATEVQHALT